MLFPPSPLVACSGVFQQAKPSQPFPFLTHFQHELIFIYNILPCFKEHSDLGVEATTLRRNFFLRDKNINGNVNIFKAGMKGGEAIDF